MTPNATRLYQATHATWPAFEEIAAGPWILRDGAGGGKRASAATLTRSIDPDVDIPAAQDAMRMMGQTPLFMIREGEADLDAALEARGYTCVDPVQMWLCPVDLLTDTPIPRVTTFTIWEPLAIMRDLWAAGGIGSERLAVMDRATGVKTGILGRLDDSPAAVGFAALDGDVAMVHALDIRPAFRRRGLGALMMRTAAIWAKAHGAQWLSVICTQDNQGANGLYAALGMEQAGRYHYRVLPKGEAQ